MNKLFHKLNSSLDGFISTDEDSLQLYSSDASLYQIKPKAVAFPKNSEDCQKIVAFAGANNIALIPRGGGTSLAGQAIGDGIVVDVSRFMNHIIQINPATQSAIVQPGVVPAAINLAAEPFKLFFPPNPSTDNRCNIGGMVGNNAWGANAPLYGDTSDYVKEVEMVLADASITRFSDVTQLQLEEIFTEDSNLAKIYKTVINQVKLLRQHIQTYPWYTQGVPSNMGYRLHKLLNRITDPQSLGPPFNMAQLICGSEGTLGLMTEVTVSLRKTPAHRNLICAHFPSLFDALNAVPIILSQCTATIELLDKQLIDLAYDNPDLADDNFWIDNSAHAILLVEIMGDDVDQLEQINSGICNSLDSRFEQLHFHILLDNQTAHAWRIRKSALGMLFGIKANIKAISFVEDCAVPVQHLSDFTQRVKDVLSMLKIRCVFYGSVSRGLIHIRPLLDLSLPLHKEYLKEIQTQIFSLTEQYGGSISAKHGDGRIRAQSIKSLLGKNYLDACQLIKKSFDPNNIFNPGTIFSDQIDLDNIRPTPLPATTTKMPKTTADYSEKLDILLPSTLCHGAAVCRQTSTEINICPTFKAVQDEAYSTRGRANIIRQSFTLTNSDDEPTINHAAIDRALSHCLACQACKTDCPAHVDMALIKMQWLNIKNRSGAKSIENRIFKNFPAVCSFMSKFPNVSNALAQLTLTKSMLGVSKLRHLPAFSKTRFSKLSGNSSIKTNDKPNVIILNDVFSEYFDSDVGTSAIAVLSKMGYSVKLSPIITSLRLFLSLGWFEQARTQLKELVGWLESNTNPDDILIGLEPAEVLAMHNECMDISKGTSWYTIFANAKSRIMLLDEFVINNKQEFIDNLSRKTFKQRNIYLHTHCHQKSNHTEHHSIDALKLLPNCTVSVIRTACCGMAGNFGYKNYDLSVKVAQLDLLPAISTTTNDDLIVATGTSCRTQINDLSGRTALHTSQVFSNYLNNLID